MTKLAYVLFSYRSGDTGMKLFKEFQNRNLGGYTWRWTKGEPREKPDLIFRWGNGYHPDDEKAIQLNSKESNMNASNKLRMATLLSEGGVNFPKVVFDLKNDKALEEIADENGKVFIRSSVGLKQPVRYDSIKSIRYGDVYATQNTKKLKEYRLHIVGDKVICTFEKKPYEGRANTPIYKDDNCQYYRRDDISFGETKIAKEIRKQSLAATRAMGLTTSGIDAFELEDGSVVIGEVNSAPGINTPGIQRWADAFEKLFEEYELNSDEL